jgi:hypothetical protein
VSRAGQRDDNKRWYLLATDAGSVLSTLACTDPVVFLLTRLRKAAFSSWLHYEATMEVGFVRLLFLSKYESLTSG